MNILDKIKQIFKNFGKKQKLLEAPKDKVEEIAGGERLDESIERKEKQSTFKDELRFNPEDLLDPRVCQGDDVIPNILKTLGVNKAILDNPLMMEELRKNCGKIFSQHGIMDFKFGVNNNYKAYNREEIDTLVSIIKSQGTLSNAEISESYEKGGSEENIGIQITDSGEVLITNFSKSQYPDGKYAYNKTIAFKCLEDNKTLMENTLSIANPQTEGMIVQTENEYTYNEDGLEMSRENRSFDRDGKINNHTICTRDSEYPFVVHEKTLIQDGVEEEHEEVAPIDNSNLYYTISETRDVNGKREITFENKEQIEEYYNKNKTEITQAFFEQPSRDYMGTKEKNKLMNGLKRLAKEAGILNKEQESEKSE